MNPDQAILISRRVKDLRESVPGSVLLPCAGCAERVWVSPASLANIASKEPDFIVLCAQCGTRYCEDKDTEFLPLSRGQIQEIENIRKDHE